MATHNDKIIEQLQKRIAKLNELVSKLRQESVVESAKYLSRNAMAASLGLTPYKMQALIADGIVPGPTHRLPRKVKAYYLAADLPKLKDLKDSFGSDYLTKREMERRLGISSSALWYMIATNRMPKPSHQIPGRVKPVYLAEDLPRLKEMLAKKETGGKKLYTINAAAEMFGLTPGRLFFLMRSGKVPAPTFVLPGKIRPHYLPEDLAAVKDALGNLERRPNQAWTRFREQGLYTQRNAAAELGVPAITFQLWRREGVIPRPTRKATGVATHFYNAEDLDAMRQILKDRGYTYTPRRKK